MQHNLQWLHKIAKANNVFYTQIIEINQKCFLNILHDTMEYGKLFQTVFTCEKKEK